jgi:predicted dehydrogenase/threonine dehydrogenase-like Zn-dependent dehydrogenase
MRQIVQELGTGRTVVRDVPGPVATRGSVCIATRCSLISAGTERTLVRFGRAGWLERARQQPDKLRQVLEKIITDGFLTTVDAVRSKLDEALPLGYSNVGLVLAAGEETDGLRPGDRVVSNGPHAEVVVVPRNLCARVPDTVTDESAAFAVLAAIGLQGVRLAAPTIGESFAVIGLGLIGLLSVQLLRANGCRVIGIDPDPAKAAIARRFGAVTVDLGAGEDAVVAAQRFSDGRGIDGILITAATSSNEPVSQAARMSRKRGRIVLVGVAGLTLSRADFYEKELSFQVSCSYGPGRYDPSYEELGHDYPVGFVRWTEQRNMEAVLDLMERGAIDVAPLISHRFGLEDAPRAYDLLADGHEPHLGILLEYSAASHDSLRQRTVVLSEAGAEVAGALQRQSLAIIGAGNYARRMLVPAFSRAGARLLGVASRRGLSAAHLARKFGMAEATTDAAALIADPRVDAVVIATRHDSHGRLVCEALSAAKHVYVEKPLAITAGELDEIEKTWRASTRHPLLMVGFNRRFAPLAVRMKALLAALTDPKTVIITVNAGAIPAAHWTQSAELGGGRLIGEGCHFIDFMRFLIGAPIQGWHLATLGRQASGEVRDDKISVTISFSDGSIGTLHYLASGHAAFPKERIEVFSSGRILQLDNFCRLRLYGWRGMRLIRRWRQDKGHAACAAAFIAAIREGRPAPIPFDEIMEVSRVVVDIGSAARRDRAAASLPT